MNSASAHDNSTHTVADQDCALNKQKTVQVEIEVDIFIETTSEEEDNDPEDSVMNGKVSSQQNSLSINASNWNNASQLNNISPHN